MNFVSRRFDFSFRNYRYLKWSVKFNTLLSVSHSHVRSFLCLSRSRHTDLLLAGHVCLWSVTDDDPAFFVCCCLLLPRRKWVTGLPGFTSYEIWGFVSREPINISIWNKMHLQGHTSPYLSIILFKRLDDSSGRISRLKLVLHWFIFKRISWFWLSTWYYFDDYANAYGMSSMSFMQNGSPFNLE